jgi:hypothetical protein
VVQQDVRHQQNRRLLAVLVVVAMALFAAALSLMIWR